MNILVMAGTKDAVNIIEMLSDKNKKNKDKKDKKNQENDFSDKNIHILATATTHYGAELAQKAGAHEVTSKPLPLSELTNLIQNKNVDILIDATHPFAAQATTNAISAAKKNSIKYIRYERPSMEYIGVERVHNVNSFEEAGKIALRMVENGEKNVLHLAGVSTITKILHNVPLERLVVRVLPNNDSISKCHELGIPGQNIVAMQGVFSENFNKSLMKEYEAGAIITKESGETGGVPSKVEAALALGLGVVMVKRPEIKELTNEIVFNSLEELEKNLNSFISD